MEHGLESLPAELRVLIDFLSNDHSNDRPIAILRRPLDHKDIGPVYQNAAFRTANELDDLVTAISRTIDHDSDLHNLQGNWVLDGGTWELRRACDYWVAIAATVGRRRSKTKVRNGSDTASATSDVANYEHIPTSHSGKPCLDWTRVEIPGMSSWVQFLRSFDWASTALGAMESWPDILRQFVLSIMSNPNPRLIVWGSTMSFIYNEACVPLWGKKHPHCMGQHVAGVFAEAWENIGYVIEAAYKGEVTKLERFGPLPIERNVHGFLEDTWWDFTLLPMFGEDGAVIGTLDELVESTAIVSGERRREFVSELSKIEVKTLQELWSSALKTIETSSSDIPFALLYTVVDDALESTEPSEPASADSSSTAHPKKCVLAGSVGLAAGHPEVVSTFALSETLETGSGLIETCHEAWRTGEAVTLSYQDGSLPASLAALVSGSGHQDPIRMAIVSPIKSLTGTDTLAIMISGLNPRYPLCKEYRLFVQVTCDIIEKAAALISLPEEQRRAQKLADDVNNALAAQLRMTTLKAERSEAKFTRLASSAPTGMFMFDAQGRATYVNDTYLDMLGQTHEKHTRQSDEIAWHELIHEDDLEQFIAAWDRVTTEKVPITIEYRTKKAWRSVDKSTEQEVYGETWLLATAFPEIEADGTVSSIQGWLTDISHRKFSENLLAQRLEDALENKRQTENFIDMTSHEMRNPLSAILQSADSIVSTLGSHGMPLIHESMTLSAPVADDIVDAAQTIILCAQHQKRIVDDILTLSKLDASLLVISPDKVQTPTLITKALKMYEAEIERASIDAQLCIEPTYEELDVDWVVLDPSRLLQVIINLLTNAIKFVQYSKSRKIKICLGASYQRPTGKHHGITFIPTRHTRAVRTPGLERGHTADEDIYLQIAVYDSGLGISEDEMKSLFQRFQQASPKTYNQYGGSGLGLFISRELCELQGGQIGVASKPGQTVFTFFVRAKRWGSGMDEQRPGSSASNARPGLIRFTSASASPIAFTRRGSVALQDSSNQMTHTRSENGTVTEEFHPLTRKHSTRSSTPMPMEQVSETSAPANTNGQKKQELHVLVVEDNLINQKVMSQQLRRAGCVVHVANHGVECLDFLEKSTFCAAETPLSVVLLDLEMPTMGGLECIRHIRERQRSGKINGHVPVIAVTANARSEQISTSIEAGMDSVVTKPFRIPELVPQMEALVKEVSAKEFEGWVKDPRLLI